MGISGQGVLFTVMLRWQAGGSHVRTMTGVTGTEVRAVSSQCHMLFYLSDEVTWRLGGGRQWRRTTAGE